MTSPINFVEVSSSAFISSMFLSIPSPMSTDSLGINFRLSVGFLGLLHLCVVQPSAAAKDSPLHSCVGLHVALSIVVVEFVWSRTDGVPRANVAPFCCCLRLEHLDLKQSQDIATSCWASSPFSPAMLTYLQCDGVLRDYCCAESLAAEICHVLLALDSAHTQYVGSDFVLYPQKGHIYVFQTTNACLWRTCSVAFASTASTGFITYPRSQSNDTVPCDSDAPTAAACNLDSALLLAMIFVCVCML